MNVRGVGQYIRTQRENSRLSLRNLSGRAGVSIPYLSQIERGLRKPSADILQAIAKGLRISAETMYVQAGILEDRPAPDVVAAVMSDATITERQKQALVQIYEAFRDETARSGEASPAGLRGDEARRAGKVARARGGEPGIASPKKMPAVSGRAPGRSRSKLGGGAKSLVPRSPHPASLRPSAINHRKEV